LNEDVCIDHLTNLIKYGALNSKKLLIIKNHILNNDDNGLNWVPLNDLIDE
jgi:hypothetical protein